MDILRKTLDEMSFVFSSNEFSKRAKKNGLPKQPINNGVISIFLHQNAIQGQTRRMWRKTSMNLTIEETKSDKIAESIRILKENGYKIMKPVTDWVNV